MPLIQLVKQQYTTKFTQPYWNLELMNVIMCMISCWLIHCQFEYKTLNLDGCLAGQEFLWGFSPLVPAYLLCIVVVYCCDVSYFSSYCIILSSGSLHLSHSNTAYSFPMHYYTQDNKLQTRTITIWAYFAIIFS